MPRMTGRPPLTPTSLSTTPDRTEMSTLISSLSRLVETMTSKTEEAEEAAEVAVEEVTELPLMVPEEAAEALES